MKMLYTPINSIVVLATLGNIFGKLKDKQMETDKAGKRIIIMLVIFVIMLVIESTYIGGFVADMLG